jgi:DNA modification methylase
LVERLLARSTIPADQIVLDPFAGARSTLLAACATGKHGIGLELNPDYVAPGSVDFCATSPPYWGILRQRRSADGKPMRHYGAGNGDLGTIADYPAILDELSAVFRAVFKVLCPGAYCVVVVMALRRKKRFFPFQADLAALIQEIDFVYDDLINWDRRRPLLRYFGRAIIALVPGRALSRKIRVFVHFG